ALEAAFDRDGAFNDVALGLSPRANVDAVKDAVDRLLAPDGGVGAYTRDRQTSDWYLSGEMDQLRNTTKMVPPVFLAIAAFLLNVVIGRWIDTEREEIGLLKAFGYSTTAVAGHYVKLVLAITGVGLVLGFAGGVWLGRGLAELYQQFFHFPFLYFHFQPQVFTIAGLISVAAALLGTWGAVKRAADLPPAEAMNPPPPTTYTRTRLELWLKTLSAPNRMIVRHMIRWPGRSALTVLGNAAAVGVLIGAMFFMDAMEELLDIQFTQAERQDATVTFPEAQGAMALQAVRDLPGVLQAEPFRAVSAKLRFGGAERHESLIGIVSHARLSQVLDQDYHPVPIPERGLVLSGKLAELLGAGVGDTVVAQVTEGRRPVLRLPVVQVSETMLGSPAYVSFGYLGDVMREPGRVSGVRVKLDPLHDEAFYRRVKDTPGISSVTVKSTSVQSFRDTMAENILIMTFF
ncbi:MAG: FtsX-like permease family protein, partial [Arenibacter algicola]|nr:FtsX-like permease family protein [Arenibacter algicola]